MPGMLVHDIGTSRIGRVHKAGRDWIVYFGLTSEARFRRDTTGIGLTPDLSDPLTVQALLLLAREAWGDETIHTEATLTLPYGQRGFVIGAWDLESPANGIGPYGTEAAALVATLEAAQ